MSISNEETWQSKRSFEETNWHMLQNEKLRDVTFLVGGDKKEEIMAHKFILASRSPVFFTMFCGSLPETKGPIEIPDAEPNIFRELLRFIYTEDCDLNRDNTMSLLYCSKKYDIKRLYETCCNFLNRHITFANVCTVLQCAIQFDEEDLENQCLNFVYSNAETVLKSDDFLTISKDTLKKLIQSDYLYESEIRIYDACKRWAIAQCKGKTDQTKPSDKDIRRELGDVIYSVRFPTMSLQTFAENVTTGDILTPDEKIFVFQIIARLDSSKIPNTFPFISTKRISGTVEVKRFETNYGTQWNYGGNPDVLDFITSIPCKLSGVSLFAPCKEGSVKGEVSLRFGDSVIETKMDIEIQYTASKSVEQILFDRLVNIEPGKKYTIYVKLKGTRTFSGTNGQSKVLSEPLEVVFSKNVKSTNSTNETHGQINSLMFAILT